MKIKFLSFFAALLLVPLVMLETACSTPTQQLASANFLAGNAFATYQLGRDPSTLKGLQDLAAALPNIPTGKVTAFEMGALNAELKPLQAAANSDPKNAAAYNQIGSAISAAAQLNGKNPTVNDAILIAACMDFANGINHGIEFWQGQQSVANPPSK